MTFWLHLLINAFKHLNGQSYDEVIFLVAVSETRLFQYKKKFFSVSKAEFYIKKN